MQACEDSGITAATKMETSLYSLDLNARTYNCLRRAYMDTIEDVFAYMSKNLDESYYGLLDIRNLGIKSIEVLIDRLKTVDSEFFEKNTMLTV